MNIEEIKSLELQIENKIKNVTKAELCPMPNGDVAYDVVSASIGYEWQQIYKLQEKLNKLRKTYLSQKEEV